MNILYICYILVKHVVYCWIWFKCYFSASQIRNHSYPRSSKYLPVQGKVNNNLLTIQLSEQFRISVILLSVNSHVDLHQIADNQISLTLLYNIIHNIIYLQSAGRMSLKLASQTESKWTTLNNYWFRGPYNIYNITWRQRRKNICLVVCG